MLCTKNYPLCNFINTHPQHGRTPVEELGQPCSNSIHRNSLTGRVRNLREYGRIYFEISQMVDIENLARLKASQNK